MPGVSDSAFVGTMVELRRAAGSAMDTVALAAARRRILQQRGLTVEQMDRAGRALANDPQRAAGLFGAIDKHLMNAQTDSAHANPSRSTVKQ